ncbi:hypothetical protein [Deinococcus marmoris]|uniref:Lipoprotein n=1 Tax=Deinococcus marmoris TaxID=249408 RepID=A0A1U7P4M9_9DEIO|nr:hypothetical protein [Deinococcus marmoris]OLV20122.1 hypothetical protein BOO71_0000394 [Deinococcus marmoris]
MKYLAIILALTLSACAPVAQVLQPGEKATLTQQGLSLVVTNPGPDALTGDPSVAGDGPALNVRGVNIKPDAGAAAWCEEVKIDVGMRWRCGLPEIPFDAVRLTPLRITFVPNDASLAAQITSASLAAYRPSKGAVPVVVYAR